MMHPFDTRTIGIVLCTMSLSVAGMGHAEQVAPGTNEGAEDATADAAAAFWKGKESYEQGDYDKAREQFEAAYRITKDPDLLYNIAQTYRQRADCWNAKQTYERFLEAAPDSPHASQAKQYVAAIEPNCPTPRSLKPEVSAPQTRPPSKTGLLAAPASGDSSKKQTKRVLVLATLAAGAVVGGTAAGIAIWNHGRYDRWKEQDRDLAKGTATHESPEQWAQRQASNDQRGVDITHTNRTVLYLSLGAAASLIASSVIFFALSDPVSSPTAVRRASFELSYEPAIAGTRTYNLSLRSSF
jgi:tetratricopeptide (TPR) repeat protein